MSRSPSTIATLEKAGITEAQIDDVKDRTDLIEVFEKLYPEKDLRQEGHNLKTSCPFHTETNRHEFKLEPTKQQWFCWSGPCGGGDVFTLVMKTLHLPFIEAYKWLGGDQEITPEKKAQLQSERELRNVERERKAAEKELKITNLRTSIEAQQFWTKLSECMTHEQIAWWEKAGIPHDWQQYWGLGYSKDIGHDFYQHFYGFIPEMLQDPSHAEAYSIPYLLAGHFQTMQWRFTTPNGMGKYHFSAWLSSHAFITRPDLDFDSILVVEGAKKAMVTHILGTLAKMQVIGLPSENVIPNDILPVLQAAGSVWVLLDPDSWLKGWTAQHVATIGPNAYAVNLPGKIDDHLLAGNLTSRDLRGVLKRAQQMKRKA
jgi:hypothetical protein